MHNFDGDVWSSNGPDVLSRVMKNFFGSDTLKYYDIQLLPHESCYAIGWSEWKKFFREDDIDEVMNTTLNSFFIHLWNNLSSNHRVKHDSKSAFMLLAGQYCPTVFDLKDDCF